MLQTDPMSTVGLEYFRENGSDACGLSLARGCCWNDDVIEGIETTALIQALLRMTQLLRVALGPTGANFVKAIVADDDDADEDGGSGAGAAVPGDANRLGLKGVARSGIFIFCDVRLSALRCTRNLTPPLTPPTRRRADSELHRHHRDPAGPGLHVDQQHRQHRARDLWQLLGQRREARRRRLHDGVDAGLR